MSSNPCDRNASGSCSEAEGRETRASGIASHAEGIGTIAKATAAHAEGAFTQAIRSQAHAEGFRTLANNSNSHAEGYRTTASGYASHAEGAYTRTLSSEAHAEGLRTFAAGIASHAEGVDTMTRGSYAHAEGWETLARATAAHAEGKRTTASGIASHAEGDGNRATGNASHAEGGGLTGGGIEGPTLASGLAAHAEGFATTASGTASHAEGTSTRASGESSHAEGFETIASGHFSHAEGEGTSTAGFRNAHIMGRFGDVVEAHSWFIGNGTTPGTRGLGAKWLASDGEMYIDGAAYNTGGADFAEMFETLDGNGIDVGYFVTLEEDKIRIAASSDDYILGITSATPSLIGDSAELSWHGRYLLDEWGRRTYRKITIPAEKDQEGNVIIPEMTEIEPVINPEWDSTCPYIPRKKRIEWVPVGLVGKLLVRDDGTSKVNGYCKPNHEGIATAADSGYRVMKRTGANQALVLLK